MTTPTTSESGHSAADNSSPLAWPTDDTTTNLLREIRDELRLIRVELQLQYGVLPDWVGDSLQDGLLPGNVDLVLKGRISKLLFIGDQGINASGT